MTTKTVTGIVGAGGWGKNLVRNLAAAPDCDLRYVCDINESIRDSNSRLYPSVNVISDYKEMLADDGLEAVVVAVDAPKHYEVALESLEAGKHVFVEKPLTLTTGEAERLVVRAKELDRRLMVGHLLLYHPGILKMKEMIGRGELGEVLYMYSQRVNLGVVRQKENAWWSLAPHDISVALFLLGGRPEAVTAGGKCFLQKDIGVEDVVFATVTLDSGKLAHIHVSWLDPHKVRRITVVGTKKMAVLDDSAATEKLRIYDKGAEVRPDYVDYAGSVRTWTGDVVIPALGGGEPLRDEIEHFLGCVRDGTDPRSDGESGLEVVKVLAAGEKSLGNGGAVVKVD